MGRGQAHLTNRNNSIILRKLICWSVGLCLLCLGTIFPNFSEGHPQQVTPGKREPIIVERADSWEASGLDEAFTLVGNVQIRHGSTRLTSDHVRYNRVLGEVFLEGHVRMTRDSTTFTANQVMYYEKDRRAVGTGAVFLEDLKEGSVLTGSQAEYFQRPRRVVLTGAPRLVRQHDSDDLIITGKRLEYFFSGKDSSARALAYQGVTVVDRSESVTVTCGKAEYYKASEKAYLTDAPRLVKQFASPDDQVLVTGKRMVYNFSSKQADIFDSVYIIQGKLQGVCDTVIYQDNPRQARLLGKPIIRDASSEIRGETVVLDFEKEAVSQAVIAGNAIGSYLPEGDTRSEKSVIRGRQMVVEFEDRSVRMITATRNASSEYRPSGNTDDSPPGRNRIKASKIQIQLDHGKLIRVTAEGSVDGSYQSSRQAIESSGSLKK